MNPHLHNASDLEKIAQLEADLKTTEDLLDRQTRDTMKANARAEKAEDEVERLTRYLDGRPCEKIWRDAVRVNMGGGRESERGPVEKVQHPGSAAADPAAPWCGTCQSWPHEPDCPAARKERDG